ncbi:MAG: addiction module protein [Sulfuricurvum sp.]|nr:addiction module protein [Sulfuricurvum sp.]
MTALNANELLNQVEWMPIDLKTKLIDKLLLSLNPIQNDVETLWKNEVDKRVTSIAEGATTLVSGEEVFRKIKNRLEA